MRSWNQYKGAAYFSMRSFHFGYSQRIPFPKVVGDSRAVIDWINGCNSLQISSLDHWKARITDLYSKFDLIGYRHIYRNFNQKADLMSKRGVGLQEGPLHFKEISQPGGRRGQSSSLLEVLFLNFFPFSNFISWVLFVRYGTCS